MEQVKEVQAEAGEGGRKGIPGWLIWLPVALVIYVLSTGPVFKMFEKARSKGDDLPKAVMTIYEPLRLVYDNCRPVKWFFDWYLHDLWNL